MAAQIHVSNFRNYFRKQEEDLIKSEDDSNVIVTRKGDSFNVYLCLPDDLVEVSDNDKIEAREKAKYYETNIRIGFWNNENPRFTVLE